MQSTMRQAIFSTEECGVFFNSSIRSRNYNTGRFKKISAAERLIKTNFMIRFCPKQLEFKIHDKNFAAENQQN